MGASTHAKMGIGTPPHLNGAGALPVALGHSHNTLVHHNQHLGGRAAQPTGPIAWSIITGRTSTWSLCNLLFGGRLRTGHISKMLHIATNDVQFECYGSGRLNARDLPPIRSADKLGIDEFGVVSGEERHHPLNRGRGGRSEERYLQCVPAGRDGDAHSPIAHYVVAACGEGGTVKCQRETRVFLEGTHTRAKRTHR